MAKGFPATEGLRRRLKRIVIAYIWLDWANKSPMDLGVDQEDLDPAWKEGVMLVKGGHAAEQQKQLDSEGD